MTLCGQVRDARFEVVDLTDFALPPLDEPKPADHGPTTSRTVAARRLHRRRRFRAVRLAVFIEER
jgi:hypothetical protein